MHTRLIAVFALTSPIATACAGVADDNAAPVATTTLVETTPSTIAASTTTTAPTTTTEAPLGSAPVPGIDSLPRRRVPGPTRTSTFTVVKTGRAIKSRSRLSPSRMSSRSRCSRSSSPPSTFVPSNECPTVSAPISVSAIWNCSSSPNSSRIPTRPPGGIYETGLAGTPYQMGNADIINEGMIRVTEGWARPGPVRQSSASTRRPSSTRLIS